MNEDFITVTSSEPCGRLDVFLSAALNISRSAAAKLIKEGRVEYAKTPRASMCVETGAEFRITLPDNPPAEPQPEDISLDVVYEDNDIAVINKPAGLVVHPAPGNLTGTLVNGLLHRWPQVREVGDPSRPGIVHRLDAGTSGLMIAALNERSFVRLQEMFKDRCVTKEYLALVHGVPARAEGMLSGRIGRDPGNPMRRAVTDDGKESLTGYRVLWSRKTRRGTMSLMLCRLFTGRTHQIRVHMAALGHPLFGDTLYGAPVSDKLSRVFLHSWRLAFAHPVTGAEMKFCVHIPDELKRAIKSF